MKQVVPLFLLLGGILFLQSAAAQTADTLPPSPKPDSVLKAPGAALPAPAADSLKTDSSGKKKDSLFPVSTSVSQAEKDSVLKKKHNPRRATIYSAILPGAGQVYNHKYWKVPIVYAAIGIPAYTYFYNKNWYNKCQYALAVTVNKSQGDSLARVDPQLINFVNAGDVNDIITYRDSFRKNQDYSVLYFLLFYGLNIVDATVDAHLRDFNVNSDLSFKIKPMIIAGPDMVAGFSLVFDFHKGRPKPLNMN
jgi:hypothetical protein